jgi:hypothetical protein
MNRTSRSALAALAVACCAIGSATPAAADPDTLSSATARITALETQSAQAGERVTKARAELKASQDRLALFTKHVDEVTKELATSERELKALARQLYVNGGVGSAVLTFTLDDPDGFLAGLDRLAAAGEAQNSAVVKARAQALSLRSTSRALERERDRLAAAEGAVATEHTLAQQALDGARAELARLQADERQRVAEQVAGAMAAARAEADRQAAAEAAAQRAADPPAPAAAAPAVSVPQVPDPPVSAGTDPRFAASEAWAAQPSSQAVIWCESNGRYAINTGNGYYGAWQFDYPSWHWNGGGEFADYPHQATPEQQNYIAWVYFNRSGWRPWECAQKLSYF